MSNRRRRRRPPRPGHARPHRRPPRARARRSREPCSSTAPSGWAATPQAVLERCPQARVIGLDRDEEALALSRERLAPFGERFVAVHAVYDEIATVLAAHAEGTARGILFDLGVSSLQIDEPDRGFAYRHDAPLDMRMDQSRGITAADVLNTYSHGDLARVLKTYGEERFAGRIASAVLREREKEPFTTSARLVDLLRSAIPAASQRSGGHPAKRTFQALRIEVNAELEVWERAITSAVDVLAPGGRIAVLSYHSLEDRITKQAFAAGARAARRPASPSSSPSTPPTSASSPAVPRSPTRRSRSTTPAPPRRGCAPPNVSRPRTEPPHEPARPRPDRRPPRGAQGDRRDPAPAQGRHRARHGGQRALPRAVRPAPPRGLRRRPAPQHGDGPGLVHDARPAAPLRRARRRPGRPAPPDRRRLRSGPARPARPRARDGARRDAGLPPALRRQGPRRGEEGQGQRAI